MPPSSRSASTSIRKTSLDGSPATSYTLPATDVNGFQGFISDTSFTITSAGDAWHGVDNLEAYTAAVTDHDLRIRDQSLIS